jgi:hypothetical protein
MPMIPHYLDNRFIVGGKIVSLTSRLPVTLGISTSTQLCERLGKPHREFVHTKKSQLINELQIRELLGSIISLEVLTGCFRDYSLPSGK